MKKLFLLAILLGLSGCGDNNQNDTSQSDTKTTQLQTTELAVPIASNYKLVASSLMMSPTISPLGGWSITNSTVMGGSTLIDAAKDSRVSAALVTPNAKQVAEVLRGGVAGVALAIAVDQLLDAVDWVMDPVNNQIRYKNKEGEKVWTHRFFSNLSFSSGEEICNYYIQYIHGWKVAPPDPSGINSDGFYICYYYNKVGVLGIQEFQPTLVNEEKTLSLEAVAEQVISNADTGSLDAQVATNAATQNILNDAVQAEPVVQELENNAKNNCPSGLTNGKGDCWVCSRESYTPIRARVVYAKEVVGGLGDCKNSMNSSQLLTRRNAYSELGNARDAENSCWSPQDSNHLIEALEAKRIAAQCNTYLGVLGQ